MQTQEHANFIAAVVLGKGDDESFFPSRSLCNQKYSSLSLTLPLQAGPNLMLGLPGAGGGQPISNGTCPLQREARVVP